jgi:hypothetical protein
MRVTLFAEVPISFQKGRFGGDAFVRSLSALKNYIQQTDRAIEMPILLKQGSVGSTGNSDDMGGRTNNV